MSTIRGRRKNPGFGWRSGRWNNSAASTPTEDPGQVRDAFSWFLSIDGEDHRVPDTLLTGPARQLAEHVIKTAR